MRKMFKRRSVCDKVRGLLSPYLDEQVSTSDKALVEGHLASCSPCGEELEALRTTVKLLHQMPSVSVPRSFALTAKAEPGRVEQRRRAFPIAAFGTAAAFAVSVMVFFFAADAFNLFSRQVVDGGAKVLASLPLVTPTPDLAVPPPIVVVPPEMSGLDAGNASSQIVEAWPMWEIEMILIGAAAVLAAITLVLWLRRRRVKAVRSAS